MTLAGSLVRWAWSDSPDATEPVVRAAAARHILDGLGCALAASRLGEGGFARDAARSLSSDGKASLVGGGSTGAPAAALCNGTLLHALDFDDTHADALVHATAAVLPAALAVAEETGASGRMLLSTCIVGYEVVTRLGAAVRHGFHEHGFHATSVCGTFAAALVTARLMQLKEHQAVDALGIAGSLASGSLEFLSDGSSTKQLHPGWSGHAGILAARMAAAGARGPATILEGRNGLYRAFTGTNVEPNRVLDGLGTRWETMRMTIKPYPACQLSHATLDALLTLRDAVGDPARIEQITAAVATDSVPVVCEPAAAKAHPRTPYDAKFSLPWCAAVALLDGSLTVDSFAPASLERADVKRLAAAFRYEAYDPGVAAANAPGRVTITAGGRRLEADVPCSTGGPDRPLDDQALRSKLEANVGDSTVALELAGMVGALDHLDDLAGLGALLRSPRTASPEAARR